MLLQDPFLPLGRKVPGLQEIITDFDCFFLITSCQDIIFANSTGAGNAGGSPKRKQEDEIRDESGLGSGAGVTNDGITGRNATDTNDAWVRSMDDDDTAGDSGPGGDRKGDKMPGEDGITSITDGIAKAIDQAEDDNTNNQDARNHS